MFSFLTYDYNGEACLIFNFLCCCLCLLGSKVLYVARAQKKAEREQILRHLFEEKRKVEIMKYKVVLCSFLS